MEPVAYPDKILDSCLFPGFLYDAEEQGYEDGQILYTLEELCALRLVSTNSFPAELYRSLPQNLLDVLMSTAVKHRCHSCLEHLLFAWKREAFNLELPLFFKTWQIFDFIHSEKLLDWLSGLSQFAIQVVSETADILNKCRASSMALRTIDLSEIRLSSCALARLISVIKEKCKKTRCGCCHQDHGSIGLKGEGCCCALCDRIVVKVNFVVDSDTIKSICELLRANRDAFLSIQIIIKGLFVDSDPKRNGRSSNHDYRAAENDMRSRVAELFRLLHHEHVEFITCYQRDYFAFLCEFFPRFCNLRTLEFSGRSSILDLSTILPREESLFRFASVLKSMHSLRELHLCSLCLSNHLQLLLGELSLGLDFLDIHCCELQKADFVYLGESTHAKNLRSLDLGYQRMQLECLKTLLTSCKQLKVLRLGCCCFSGNGTCADDLMKILSEMRLLRYLDITGVSVCHEYVCSADVLKCAKSLACMTDLRSLRLSYSKDENLELVHKREKEKEYEYKMSMAMKQSDDDPARKIKIIFDIDSPSFMDVDDDFMLDDTDDEDDDDDDDEDTDEMDEDLM